MSTDRGSDAISQQQVIDPVCRMSIAAEGAPFHADYQGRRYHFCSEGCLQWFSEGPDRWVGPKADLDPFIEHHASGAADHRPEDRQSPTSG